MGLKIHPKTTIFTNQRSNRQSEATIDDIEEEVLPISEKAKYLGQTITFEQKETTEKQSRIRAAWATFSRYRQELSSRSCLPRHRFRKFNMVITPTLTYGSGLWTLSQEHEKLIRSTQRKMLRLIVQTKRKHKTKNTKEKTAENQRATKNWQEMKEVNKIRQPTRTKETARIQDVIKTATYLSRVAQMTTWTRRKLKRKNGSKISQEAQETPKTRCGQPTFHVG